MDSQENAVRKADHRIPRKSLEYHEAIAYGSFKTVYRGKLRIDMEVSTQEVAVLEFRKSPEACQHEANLLAELQPHVGFVRFFGWSDVQPPLIVTELAPLGSLADAVQAISSRLSLAHELAILCQICDAMAFMASLEMIHRDLALRNTLLFELDAADATKTLVKLCDFGTTIRMASTSAPSQPATTDAGMPVRYALLPASPPPPPPPSPLCAREWPRKDHSLATRRSVSSAVVAVESRHVS